MQTPKAEGGRVGVAGLFFEARPVDGASVEAGWCAGLEAGFAETELLEGFAEENAGGFAGTACGVLDFSAVDKAVEEGAGGDDDGGGGYGAAVAEEDAGDAG